MLVIPRAIAQLNAAKPPLYIGRGRTLSSKREGGGGGSKRGHPRLISGGSERHTAAAATGQRGPSCSPLKQASRACAVVGWWWWGGVKAQRKREPNQLIPQTALWQPLVEPQQNTAVIKARERERRRCRKNHEHGCTKPSNAHRMEGVVAGTEADRDLFEKYPVTLKDIGPPAASNSIYTSGTTTSLLGRQNQAPAVFERKVQGEHPRTTAHTQRFSSTPF
jgi:hypothetical protein